MGETLVYIVFPETENYEQSPSANLMALKQTGEINTEVLMQLFDTLKDNLLFFEYEHYIPVYEEKNLNAALCPIKTAVPAEFPNVQMKILTILRQIGVTEKAGITSKSLDSKYKLYHEDVTTTVLGDMANCIEKGKALVILDIQAALKYKKAIPVKKQYNDIELSIEIVNDIFSLYTWFTKNRKPQRQYDFNRKHGDANRRACGGSQLKTDEQETRELLYKAVGKDKKSALWYYDNKNNSFIYFENQREIRLAFHGYHIKEGESNFENIDIEKLRTVGVEIL